VTTMNIRDFYSDLIITATWSVRRRDGEVITTLVEGSIANRLTLRVCDHFVPIGYPGGEVYLQIVDGAEQLNAALPLDLFEQLGGVNGLDLDKAEYEDGDQQLVIEGPDDIALVLSDFAVVESKVGAS
jgi:hypothetical protein